MPFINIISKTLHEYKAVRFHYNNHHTNHDTNLYNHETWTSTMYNTISLLTLAYLKKSTLWTPHGHIRIVLISKHADTFLLL